MPSEVRIYQDATNRAGLTLYARLLGTLGYGAMIFPSEVGQGVYNFTVPDDTKDYIVFEQKSGDPEVTDPWLAILPANLALREIEKVPRASERLIAGGNFAWNALVDSINKLILNITKEAQ